MESEEKSYVESIASDIFNMVQSAKESGLDVDDGFQNEPFASSALAIRYLFYPKKQLLQVPGMPDQLRRKFKAANVLAQLEVGGKIVGIHLIWASAKKFAELTSEEESLTCTDEKGVDAYKTQVTKVLRDDLAKATAAAEAASAKQQ